jgi:3-keto-L-gulonate-6-phosphate decarboxylase
MEMLESSVEAMHEAGNELIKIGAWGEGKIAANAKLAKEGYEIATTSTIIEQGVKNLAAYNITLAVAGEGFSSVEELDRALESKAEQLHEAAAELQRAVAQKQRYEGQYNAPTKGRGRR